MTQSLPPASVHGTWIESIEVRAADDDELINFSGVDEITLHLRDPDSMFNEITLTKSGGDITLPSTGIIQWRAEVGVMQRLSEQLYDVVLTIEEDDDTILFYLGNISVLE